MVNSKQRQNLESLARLAGYTLQVTMEEIRLERLDEYQVFSNSQVGYTQAVYMLRSLVPC